MELRDYLRFAKKWAWLIVLLTAIAIGGSYWFSLRIPPTYRTETTLLVGQLQSSTGLDPNSVYASSNLAQAYALLVSQPPLLQAAADVLNWPGGWQDLYFRVSASASGGQLIRITANSGTPQEAKAIADEVARQLILQSPVSQQQKQAEEQRTFVASQQAILKAQIENAQKTLNDLNNQLTLENDPAKLADLNTRVTALQTKVDTWQKNYADLSALLNTASDKFITVLAPARLPTTPYSPDIVRNVLLAALAGFAAAIGLGYLVDYLDNTIKDNGDVERELRLSTLGAITRITGIRQPTDHLITVKHPRSPISEAYRVLRTNLRFSGIENPSGALLVTSAGPGEGKTTTAANLAVTLAQTGKRVVLVDTDLRRPSLHRLFDLSNSVGLTNLFLDDSPRVEAALQQTGVAGLRVLTSGQIPPNPAEVLDSKRMSEILTHLREESDMVVLDSPPVLAVADASIIGSKASGAVLVIDAGKTRSDVAQRAVETLNRTNVKIVGVVLNKLSSRRASGYYYYYYYSSQDKHKPDAHKPA